MSRNRLLTVLLGSAFMLAYCVPPEGSAAVRIACVGDSITWGSIIHDRPHNSYPGQLSRRLGKGFVVGNFGASGSFVLRGTPKPFRDDPFFQESLQFRPNIVVLSLGTNDAKPEVWSHGKDHFYRALSELVDQYQGLPERPRLILALPPPIFSQKPRADNLAYAIRPQIIRVAHERNLELLDLGIVFEGRKDLFWDGIHPTIIGYSVLARTVANEIERTTYVASLQ